MHITNMFEFKAWLAAAAFALSVAVPAHAEDAQSPTPVAATSTSQEWQKGPKDFPPGMRVMPLQGDPMQPGPYVYRVRVPSGYVWPPMKFPEERNVKLLKGKLWYSEGERRNPKDMQELEAGATFTTPANTPHYQWARTEVILEITGTGPVSNVSYVNPEDDPRQR
jgi:hypothetical protein